MSIKRRNVKRGKAKIPEHCVPRDTQADSEDDVSIKNHNVKRGKAKIPEYCVPVDIQADSEYAMSIKRRNVKRGKAKIPEDCVPGDIPADSEDDMSIKRRNVQRGKGKIPEDCLPGAQDMMEHFEPAKFNIINSPEKASPDDNLSLAELIKSNAYKRLGKKKIPRQPDMCKQPRKTDYAPALQAGDGTSANTQSHFGSLIADSASGVEDSMLTVPDDMFIKRHHLKMKKSKMVEQTFLDDKDAVSVEQPNLEKGKSKINELNISNEQESPKGKQIKQTASQCIVIEASNSTDKLPTEGKKDTDARAPSMKLSSRGRPIMRKSFD